MGKTTTYAVDEKVLAKLIQAMSPKTTLSATYDFLTAGAETTRQPSAPQNDVVFK